MTAADIEVAGLTKEFRVAKREAGLGAALRALQRPVGVRVGDLSDAAGLSPRRFIEVFEREVGLTPKLYARIQRFHGVKRDLAARGAPTSWTAFALARGYFDQSHMIREFVGFSGMSPTSYLRSRDGETMFDHHVHAYRGDPAHATVALRTEA